MTVTEARLLDAGFRGYSGPRRGIPGTTGALALSSAQRALGLRRSFRHKAFPILMAIIAFVPAIVSVVTQTLPAYVDYYEAIRLVVLLFIAFVAPEVICTDRRHSMLGLYFSAVTRTTYLLAKLISVVAVIGLLALLPPLFLLAGYQVQGLGPESLGEAVELLGQMMAAALILGLTLGSFSLAVSSLTDRRAFASAGILAILIGAGILVAIVDTLLDVPRWVALFDIGAFPFEAVRRVFGEAGDLTNLGHWEIAGANLALVVFSLGLLWLRYVTIKVTK